MQTRSLSNWRRIVVVGMVAVSMVLGSVVIDAAQQRGVVIEGDSNQRVELYATGSYALLIGESSYTTMNTLGNTPSELTGVENVLKMQGFQVETHLDLTSADLRKAVDAFIQQHGFDKESRLLIFFSGHGHTVEGEGYFVPIDAPNPYSDEKGFLQKALDMNQVMAWARGIKAKHVLFLFDSCFSGSVFKAKDDEPPRHISEMTTLPVRQIITAGSEKDTVPAKSVFTPAFVDALRYGLGDLDGDGYITGTELGRYLRKEVPQYTKQVPQFGVIDRETSRGDFVFEKGAPQVIVEPTPTTKPTPQPEPITEPFTEFETIPETIVDSTPIATPVPGNFKVRTIAPVLGPQLAAVRKAMAAIGVQLQEKKTGLQQLPAYRLTVGYFQTKADTESWAQENFRPRGIRYLIYSVQGMFSMQVGLYTDQKSIDPAMRELYRKYQGGRLPVRTEMTTISTSTYELSLTKITESLGRKIQDTLLRMDIQTEITEM